MNTTGDRGPQERRVFLDGLRFLAAVWVFLFHFGRNHMPESLNFLKPLANTGAWGVSFFFVLSGFVLMEAYSPFFSGTPNLRKALAFGVIRWLRLAPVYYVVLVVFLLLYGLVLSESVTWSEFLLHLTMTQAWFHNTALSLNFPAWSLSCEIFYYGLFPVLCPLVFLLRKKLRAVLPILTLVLVPIWAATGLQIKWGLYHPLTNLPLFLSGMMLASCQDNTKAYLYGLLMWLIGMLVLPFEQRKIMFLNGYGAAPLCVLMVLGASRLTCRSSFVMQILIHAGLWSYPFYLAQYFSALLTKYLYWQFFSQLLKGFDWRHIFWVNFFVALVLTYGVEKPFDKIRKSVKKRLLISEL